MAPRRAAKMFLSTGASSHFPQGAEAQGIECTPQAAGASTASCHSSECPAQRAAEACPAQSTAVAAGVATWTAAQKASSFQGVVDVDEAA